MAAPSSQNDNDGINFQLLLTNISREIEQRNVCLDMIKFALFDFVRNRQNLEEAESAFDIFKELHNANYIRPDNVTLLVAVFKLLGLNILNNLIADSEFSTPDIQPIDVFSSFRISMVNMGIKLYSNKRKHIANVFRVPKKESVNAWTLFQYLHDNNTLTEAKLMDFVEKAEINKDTLLWQPPKIPSVTTKGVNFQISLEKRKYSEVESSSDAAQFTLKLLIKSEDNTENELYFLTRINQGNLQNLYNAGNIADFFFKLGAYLKSVEKHCVVFHLFSYDPEALKKVHAMCLNGQLLKELAEIIVTEKYIQEFLNEWVIRIDDNKFKSALHDLEGTEFDFYIISDGAKTWEENVIQELKKRREGIRCISSSNGNPGKNKVDNLINKSHKVIAGFTSEPHTAGESESIISHGVQEMFEKIILVKITPNAVIPRSLQMVNAAEGWTDTFYDILLDALDDNKSEPMKQEEKIRYTKIEAVGKISDVISIEKEFNANTAGVIKITEEIKKEHGIINEDNKNFEKYLKLSRKKNEVKEKQKKIRANMEHMPNEKKKITFNLLKCIDDLQTQVKKMLSSFKMMNKPDQTKPQSHNIILNSF